MKTIDLLTQFVNRRPGLDFSNYGDYKLYHNELNEINRDKKDFYELLGLASRRIENLEEKLTALLSDNSGRLFLENGEIVYHTGQYFPTEYRPAACAKIARLIWLDYANEKENGEPIYKDGHEIRHAISRNVSRRVMKNYF